MGGDGKRASDAAAAGKEPKARQPADAAATVPQTVPYFSLYQAADALDYLAMSMGLFGAIVNGVTMPLFAVVFGELIDTFGAPGANLVDDVNQIALYFVYLAITTLVASYLEVGFFMWSGQRQVSRLRRQFLEAALYQDISFYDTQASSGDVLSGLNEDCTAIQNAISEKFSNVVHHISTFVVAIGISLYRGWQLALVLLALTPLIAVAGALLAMVLTTGSAKSSEAYSKAGTLSNQSITNIRTVASFGAEDTMYQKFVNLLKAPARMDVLMNTLSGSMGGVVNAAVFVTYGVAFWYGAKLVRGDNGYTGGLVMNVIFGAIIGGFSLGQAAPNFGAFALGQSAGARVLRMIKRQPEIDVLAKGTVPSGALKGQVEIRDVVFRYPAQPDVAVFNGLNLTIDAGSTVALVGQSGSGKSTVIQLLERFYDPEKGSVLVDGCDIKQLSLEWYRNQVGLVAQEPVLFATSILENIAMGLPAATEADIIAAARNANAHQFIAKLPEKYRTQVGERGVQLSGGQKQRIAIARALLKNPKLLLLDEATSALDNVSERLVQSALDKLAVGRTTVIVAHRLSTIRSANKIAVIQAGNVVEQGTHDDLYSDNSSVYHSLVKLQEQAMDQRAAVGADDAEAEDPDEVLLLPPPPKFAARDTSDSVNAIVPADMSQELGHVVKEKKKKVDGEEEELTEEEKAVKVGFLRLLSMNKQEWPYLVVGILASAACGVVMPLFAVFLSEMVSVFYKTGEEAVRAAVLYSSLFYALAVGFITFGTIQGYSFAVVGSSLSLRVRQLFFRAVLHMEIGWFDKDENSSGALTSRLGDDAPMVRGAVGDVLGVAVQNVVTLVAGYVIAIINGWRMALVVTASLPLLAFSSYMQMQFFTGLDNKGGELFGQANQTANESILALRTVQSYNLQHRVVLLYNQLLAGPMAAGARNAHLSGFAFGLSQMIMFGVYSLAFWYGGIQVENGRMDLSNVLKVFFSILLASMGASQAQMQFPALAKGGKAVQRVFRVVDRQSEIDASHNEGEEIHGRVSGKVELLNVTFCYPTRPDVVVFKNFNLLAAAGQVTALVGESGSGKSTVVSLVERFYDPLEGQVLLDGIDLRQLKLKWLRSRVGLVGQEPVLFNGTLLENLTLGVPNASIDEVIAACQAANALEFIEKQTQRFATQIGEGGGIALSGGQKQRIAIARAILKDPVVMLLDEATSALDAASERMVQDALDTLMKGRTSIVVAHRLTTVRNADKIAVVQHGVVLEQGTHDELMKMNSAYTQLARAQAGH